MIENGYSLCFNSWALDKDIKSELGLLLIISSLTAKDSYCYASNKYFADLFSVDEVSISRKLKKLLQKKYITIQYEKRGCQVVKRHIRLTKMLTDDLQKSQPTINKNVKDNNISINNTSINKKKERKEKNFDIILKENFESEKIISIFYEFIKMRQNIKKPLTDYALILRIKDLQRLSKGDNEKAIKILNQSITGCWQDLYELKDEKTNGKTKPNAREYSKGKLDNLFENIDDVEV